MTIIIGHDHYDSWHSMIIYNYATNQLEDNQGNHLVWIKPEYLDRRKSYLTLFNFDPFTGNKINLKLIKYMLANRVNQ